MAIKLSTNRNRRLLSRFIQERTPDSPSESDDDSVGETFEKVSAPDEELGVNVDEDTTFPFVTLPPGVKVSSYSTIVRHLRQSKFILDAFRKKFGIYFFVVYTLIDLADGKTLRNFLDKLQTPEGQVSYLLTNQGKYFGHSMTIALSPFMEFGILCQCLLVSIYTNEINSIGNDKEKLRQYSKSWTHALNQLHMIQDDSMLRRIKLYEPYQDAVIKAFNVRYDDPDGLVDVYTRQLVQNMDGWIDKSTEYYAPDSSVINSSMMGKSRLIKEIAANIPTVYICVREVNDGYPMRVHQYCVTIYSEALTSIGQPC